MAVGTGPATIGQRIRSVLSHPNLAGIFARPTMQFPGTAIHGHADATKSYGHVADFLNPGILAQHVQAATGPHGAGLSVTRKP